MSSLVRKNSSSYTIIEKPSSSTLSSINIELTKDSTAIVDVINGVSPELTSNKVKIDLNDPNSGFLLDKIKNGDGIIIEVASGLDLNKVIQVSTRKTLFLVDAITVTEKITNFNEGPLTIDGFTVALGSKILVINQDNEYENGIYEVRGPIGINSGPWVRSQEANNFDKFKTGALVFSTGGSANYHKLYFLISNLTKDGWIAEPKRFVTTSALVVSEDIYYNNSNSTLTSTNINAAINELDSKIISLQDKNFNFSQATPSNTWNITHNLNKRPSVVIYDSSGREVIGDVRYVNLNVVEITFESSFSGFATLN